MNYPQDAEQKPCPNNLWNKKTIGADSTNESTEIPGGIVLNGYDNVGDAVAEFSILRNRAKHERDFGKTSQIAIELPDRDLLAGAQVFGMVRLVQPSNLPVEVMLRSSKPGVADIPDSVTVSAGQTVALFPIMTFNPGSVCAPVMIQALLPDGQLFHKTITVRYNLGLSFN